jgi:hypothetical protein
VQLPVAVEGKLHGRMIRQSLDVRSWEPAQKIVRGWEIHGQEKSIFLPDAYDRYLENQVANGSAVDTLQKHRRLKKLMVVSVTGRCARSPFTISMGFDKHGNSAPRPR